MPPARSTTIPQQVAHNGIEYRGEIISARRWDPSFGRELREDAYFRVVFLQVTDEIAANALQDSRIAVCIPGSRLDSASQEAERDLRVVRETQAQYLTE